MSEYQFKVGDKVKYKANEHQAAINNGHDPYKVHTICMIGTSDSVYFEGEKCCCFISRLEPVKESTPETFDYHQALKILAENPEAEVEFSANGVFWGKVAIPGEIRIPTGNEFCFRLKPRPKKYQWLCKNKDGRYSVTTMAYKTKEEAEFDYTPHGWKVIKALDETIL